MIARISTCQYRVLIAGGCYGGLSAAVNLLEKCDTLDSPISVDITIVDERDGYCMSARQHPTMRYRQSVADVQI